MTQRTAPIVVGVDGSEASLAALRWAAGEAAAHGAPLVVVHVLDPRARHAASYAGALTQDAEDLDEAALMDKLLDEGEVGNAGRIFEIGVPSVLLVRHAIGARMLVLGHADHHRRHDGDGDEPRPGPPLGSVARACVANATCPVVVVPVPARRSSPGNAEPEPRHVPVARHAPLVGGRALYPARTTVPFGHG